MSEIYAFTASPGHNGLIDVFAIGDPGGDERQHHGVPLPGRARRAMAALGQRGPAGPGGHLRYRRPHGYGHILARAGGLAARLRRPVVQGTRVERRLLRLAGARPPPARWHHGRPDDIRLDVRSHPARTAPSMWSARRPPTGRESSPLTPQPRRPAGVTGPPCPRTTRLRPDCLHRRLPRAGHHHPGQCPAPRSGAAVRTVSPAAPQRLLLDRLGVARPGAGRIQPGHRARAGLRQRRRGPEPVRGIHRQRRLAQQSRPRTAGRNGSRWTTRASRSPASPPSDASGQLNLFATRQDNIVTLRRQEGQAWWRWTALPPRPARSPVTPSSSTPRAA